MAIQKIIADLSNIPCPFGTRRHAERVETGALEINGDWPGIFIRGDDCLQYSMHLRKAVEVLKQHQLSNMDAFTLSTLEGLAGLLESSRI